MNLAEMTEAELIKRRKSLQAVIGIFFGFAIVLACAQFTLFVTAKDRTFPTTVFLALTTIVLSMVPMIQGLRQITHELERRAASQK